VVTVSLALTAAFACLTLAMLDRFAPRCPECGSRSVAFIPGFAMRVCEQCKTVWRM
jgi:hypothetical protein